MAGNYPNTTSEQLTYSSSNQLLSINLSSPTAKLASLTNTYDRANLITGQSVHFSGQPATSTSYGYSSLNQLTSATSRLNNLTNSYESAGNLLTNGPEVIQSYNGAGELVSQAWRTRTESYSYDQNGNRTKELGTQNETLFYSGVDQLTTLESGSSTYNYTYKGNNIRYSQTYNGTTTYYVYNTQSSVPQLLEDGTNDYIYGPSGVPMEQISQSSGVPSYLFTDQLGSVVMEANQSGNVTGTQNYGPYGTVSSTTGTWTTPFGYAGGYTDPTGLSYLINRYYDSATGQFVSVDPDVQETNQAYSYVNGNPVDRLDSMGLASFTNVDGFWVYDKVFEDTPDVFSLLLGAGMQYGEIQKYRRTFSGMCLRTKLTNFWACKWTAL